MIGKYPKFVFEMKLNLKFFQSPQCPLNEPICEYFRSTIDTNVVNSSKSQ